MRSRSFGPGGLPIYVARIPSAPFVRLFDHFRSLQNFEANHATVVAKIGNNPRTNLITFLHARIAERNGQRVRFLVVLSLHARYRRWMNFDFIEAKLVS